MQVVGFVHIGTTSYYIFVNANQRPFTIKITLHNQTLDKRNLHWCQYSSIALTVGQL